jgi:L-ribulose-5-phosphate 4-epimerase
MSQFDELKERVYQSNMELPLKGVVIYSFGNASAIDREQNAVAIKPSGVPYEKLQPEDIIVVDMQGNRIEGTLRPSSDTKTHLVLYRHFPNIGGIAHTHSPYAVAWAQAGKAIPILGTTHADHLTSDVPCTRVMADEMIKGDYETETGNQIIELFSSLSYEEIEMLLVACHGPFTWGRTVEQAVYNAVILEELAKIAYFTLQLNAETPRLKSTLIDKHYLRKHGKNAYYGQSG